MKKGINMTDPLMCRQVGNTVSLPGYNTEQLRRN